MAYQRTQQRAQAQERVVVKGQLSVYCGAKGYEVYGTSHAGKSRTFLFPTLAEFKEAMFDRFVANPPAEDGWATRFSQSNNMESAGHGTVSRVNKAGEVLAPWKVVMTANACIGVAMGWDNRPSIKKIDDVDVLDEEEEETEADDIL